MTNYTEHPDTLFDPQKPILGSVTLQARDNLIAAFEAGDSAPRLNINALERVSAGDEIRSSFEADTRSSTSAVPLVQIGIIQTGTLRFYGQHRGASGGTSRLELRRTRNNAALVLAAWSTSSTSWTARTADFSVLPGDFLQVLVGPTGGGSSDSRYLRIMTNGEDLWPGPGNGNVTGNTVASAT